MKNTKKTNKKRTKKEKSLLIIQIKKRVEDFQRMIHATSLTIQRYKSYDILTANEVNACINNLEMLYGELVVLTESLAGEVDCDDIISRMQVVNDELSSVFRVYGAANVEDLLDVCFGKDYVRVENIETSRWDIIKRFLHPVGYKILTWKSPTKKTTVSAIAKNRIVEDFVIVESSDTLDCFDLARTSQNFYVKVHGIKVSFQNHKQCKTLIVSGVIDDVLMRCFEHEFIADKLCLLRTELPKDPEFETEDFSRFVDSLTIKELLIYSNTELYDRYIGYVNQLALIKQKPMSQNVKEFLNNTLYSQRATFIQLLVRCNNPEFQYLAYLLYDLLSNDNNGNIDTIEQTILYDSLPWSIKKFFRDAMKVTIQYTNNLSNFDNSKVPLEQQICLMKAPDSVKEKAMVKLKEVKAKSEDSGSKARQYLEGLLRVPFDVYRDETVLKCVKELIKCFKEFVERVHGRIPDIPLKDSYTLAEVNQYCELMETKYMNKLCGSYFTGLVNQYCAGKKGALIGNIRYINAVIKQQAIACRHLCFSGKKNKDMCGLITEFINAYGKQDSVKTALHNRFSTELEADLSKDLTKMLTDVTIKRDNAYGVIQNTSNVLNEAIYGHRNAKQQIKRIIGQWINGEHTGYCFGFEGPPGLGKTTLAKRGLARCLQDENGVNRPFSFIALGGSSNGSILDGHNYTYVGSIWGKIVDILMESKCMNPIIFIDELDKVSNTEHGKEIVGILTHLVDSTQNDAFQDKYFTGVNLDLSKALFIFSYNDASKIDRILLDRIHQIKFDPLTLEDKVIITNKYILPELYGKMGVVGDIVIPDDVIEHIIESYTFESGVRKLKETLFEIVSEINLEFLENKTFEALPVCITLEMIKSVYLKERQRIRHIEVMSYPEVGIVNGLWANAYGRGGIIPIEASFFPSSTFLEMKLTGMQGDVMKESMHIAKTIAWSLTLPKRRNIIMRQFNISKLQGVHAHCPEGAVHKDGPSAGAAVTVALYSLFNNKKINNLFGMTGEIDIRGHVTAIGGLELKFVGGIRGGVRSFIYPEANQEDFLKFVERYKGKQAIENVSFHPVKTIHDVFALIFV